MGIADWMRVIDTVSGLAQMSGKARPRNVPATQDGSPGMLETRLAGGVVAALKEAFDRDRARMDLLTADTPLMFPIVSGASPAQAPAGSCSSRRN